MSYWSVSVAVSCGRQWLLIVCMVEKVWSEHTSLKSLAPLDLFCLTFCAAKYILWIVCNASQQVSAAEEENIRKLIQNAQQCLCLFPHPKTISPLYFISRWNTSREHDSKFGLHVCEKALWRLSKIFSTVE